MIPLTNFNLVNKDEAFTYFVECHLATLEMMLNRSRVGKGEIKRMINIAEVGLGWIKSDVPDRIWSRATRIRKILESKLSVAEFYEKDKG